MAASVTATFVNIIIVMGVVEEGKESRDVVGGWMSAQIEYFERSFYTYVVPGSPRAPRPSLTR